MSISIRFLDQEVSFDGNILVELTKRCNYECVHCYADASPHAQTAEPSPHEIHALVASARRLGFRAITLSGGELMLRRDIDTIIEGLPSGVAIWLFSSGIRLDAKRLSRWTGKVTGYTVSLDGGRVQHNTLRRSPRSYDDIIGFLRRLGLLRLRVQLQSMVQRGQLSHLEPVVALAEVIGVERILFSHISPDGRGRQLINAQMNASELDDLFYKVQHLARQTVVQLHTNLLPRNMVSTRFPKPVIHILPSGEVLPWFGVSSRFSLGNLTLHGWDLEAMLSQQPFPAVVATLFALAQERATTYQGYAVPVDDLLVLAFRGALTCNPTTSHLSL